MHLTMLLHFVILYQNTADIFRLTSRQRDGHKYKEAYD